MSRGKGCCCGSPGRACRRRIPDVIEEIRGEGLMQGIKLRVPDADFAAAARAEKLIVIPAGDNVVRMLPPLVISEDEIARRRLTPSRNAACALFRGAGHRRAAQGPEA